MSNDEAKSLNLGKKIREIRLRRGLTLQQLSELTGLSKPSLSQIENEVTVPPIATLLKISRALGKHIADFFQEATPLEDRISVVRAEERKEIMSHLQMEARRIGYRYESLAYHLSIRVRSFFLFWKENWNSGDRIRLSNSSLVTAFILIPRFPMPSGD